MLSIFVVLSAAFALLALSYQVFKTFSAGRKEWNAPAEGSVFNGVVYAFGKGMMPWEKESASKHLPTYFMGVVYHLGIACALLILVLSLLHLEFNGASVTVGKTALGLGIAAGIGLLLKRISFRYLRAISCADDYVSSVLVILFMMTSLGVLVDPRLLPAFYSIAIVLFLYVPAGKIRHCFFFFYSRILFGEFFGRRGVLPRQSSKA